ncbi:MAG: TatD family hydrolase [Pseudomonadales bacterium]
MIDIGANLLSGQFDADREQVLTRARQAGVKTIIVTATDLEESRAATDYCAARPELFCTAGIHPHDASAATAAEIDSAVSQITSLAKEPVVVAIGETGLDYFRDFTDPGDQRRVCAAQLTLAKQLKLPVFAHDRDASEDMVRLIKASGINPATIVIHCFTGDELALQRYLDLGCMIGITGWLCDTKRGAELREIVGQIPADRIMIETDAPYLRPHNAPKDALASGSGSRRRNEPALLPYVAQTLAKCMGLSVADLIAHSSRNAQQLFPRLNLQGLP